MPHATVDRPEGRQQPVPGVVPPFQNLLAMLVTSFLEPGHEGRDGIMLVVERVAQEQEAPLLGREQKNQPHHDRQGRFIKVGLGDARQQFSLLVPVDPVERADDHLDGLTDLIAQAVGGLPAGSTRSA